MCDSEHMFDCPNPADTVASDDMQEALSDLEFNRFLQHTIQVGTAKFPSRASWVPPQEQLLETVTFQVDPSMRHKSLVAKKFHYQKVWTIVLQDRVAIVWG